MKLRDVLDLEVQLALDEGQDDRALRTRDRSLYLSMAEAPAGSDGLLSAWLAALRERLGGPQVGERFEGAQRVLSYVLAIAGLSVGWGTAELLLHFEQGGAPVNVGYFVLVMVLGQLATLVLLALSTVLRRAIAQLPVVGDVGRLLRFLTLRLQRLMSESTSHDERLEAQRAALQRVRTRMGLYQDLERYALLGQSQLFALCFNLGALASCVRLILLSDLAFAWSTSVASLDAEQVQRVCALLAWPFGWLIPEAVPSADLIEHTQYFRLEGRFAGAEPGTRGNAALAGEWWRFLVACTVTYGLLPRIFTLSLFRYRLRRAERRVPLDTPSVQRVLARMTTPEVATQAPRLAQQGAEPARHVSAEATSPTGAASLVLYRDLPTSVALLTAELVRHLGVRVEHVLRAGGFDAQDEAALLAQVRASRSSACLVTEAWEAPDKSLRNLLAALREALGPRQTLRVVLVGEASEHGYAAPADADVRLFRDRLTLLADPYLTVETLPAAREDEHRPEEARA